MKYIKAFSLFFLLFFLLITKLRAQQTLIDTDPVSVYNKAVELYEHKKYSAAIDYFERFKKLGEDKILLTESDLYIALSAKALKLGNTERLFLAFLEKYPERQQEDYICFELGHYYFNLQNYSVCIEWLLNIKEIQKLDISLGIEYYFMLGYANYMGANSKLALENFSKIDNYNNPYYNIANYYEGYIYYSQGEYHAALDKFLKIMGEHKFSTIVPIYITHLYLLTGQYAQAINYGENSLLNPKIKKRETIRAYIAEANMKQQKYQEAERHYKELDEEGYPLNERDKYNYAFCCYLNANYTDCGNILNRIIVKEDSFGQNVSYLMGLNYLKTGKKMEAGNSFYFASGLDFIPKIKEESLINYARISYELNQSKEAMQAIRKFIKSYPDSEYNQEARSLLSDLLLQTNNYKEALEIIEEIERTDPKTRAAYQQITYFYGLELFNNKEYINARDYFVLSIKNAVDNRYKALAYFWLGETYYLLNEYSFALREYQNFLFLSESKITPYYSVAYYNAAYCCMKEKDYPRATGYFKKYLELDNQKKHSERYFDACLRMADCNMLLKNYSEAIKHYDIVIENNFREKDYALFQKALLLGLMEKNSEKLHGLKQLIEQNPNSRYVDDAIFEIANMHFFSREYDQAIVQYNYLIQDFPKSPFVVASKLGLGLSYYNKNEDTKALEYLEDLVMNYPYTNEARDALTAIKKIYIEQGEAEKLFAFMNSIPKTELTASFQDSAMYQASFSHMKRNDCNKAVPAFEKYLHQFPNGFFSVESSFYLANCAVEQKRNTLALEHYEKVIEKSPNPYTERALVYAADMHYENKDYEKALQRYIQLEESAIISSNVNLASIGQMRCYYYLKEYDLCINKANEVLEFGNLLGDIKTETYYYMGRSCVEMKNFSLAKTYLKKVYENNRGVMGAEAKYDYIHILFIEENYDLAITEIVDLKQNFSGADYFVAEAYILLAEIFVKTGDLFQARHTLNSIIRNFKGNSAIIEEAEEKLKEVDRIEKQIESDSTERFKPIEIESQIIK